MKEEVIKFRIPENLKKDYQLVCDRKNTTMSTNLIDFITNEVMKYHKEKQTIDFQEIVKSFGINNVTIIGSPTTFINSKPYAICTYNMSLFTFLTLNKDKKIYLYLEGCELDNNKIRGFVID